MNICYEIGSRLYRRRIKARTVDTTNASQSAAAYWDWQLRTSPEYFAKCLDLMDRLPGARVLDIGCGLGGRTCYLATQGVRSMVAIDINTDEIARAKELVQRVNEPDIRSLISFQAVKEGVPLDMDPFDIVLLVDSMEHVRDPVAMLNLAYSMTRPGGVCYFSTMGWYHYSASHVGGIIPIPFLTLLFDDKTILDAVRRIVSMPEYRRSMWDSDPPVLRWENVNDLHDRPGEYLNKITVRGLRQAMNKSRFAGGRLRVMGFSWRRHSWMRWLNVLTRIPVIQEAYHSAVFGRLERNGSEL